MIDLPFEGRKAERRQKYRRERVPKTGSRGEETITEPINSHIGEFHTVVVGKCCLPCGTWLSHWRWDTRGQFISRKDIQATLWRRDRGSRVKVKEGSPIKRIAFDSTLSRREGAYKGKNPRYESNIPSRDE